MDPGVSGPLSQLKIAAGQTDLKHDHDLYVVIIMIRVYKHRMKEFSCVVSGALLMPSSFLLFQGHAVISSIA